VTEGSPQKPKRVKEKSEKKKKSESGKKCDDLFDQVLVLIRPMGVPYSL